MVGSGESFLRQIRRTTIHGSGCQETQGKVLVSAMNLDEANGCGKTSFLGIPRFRKGSYFILEGNLIVLPATMKAPLPR
jgi:hypothetical protein